MIKNLRLKLWCALIWAGLRTSVYSPSILTGWPPRRPRPSPARWLQSSIVLVLCAIGGAGSIHLQHSTLPLASQWCPALWCYKVLVSHFIEYKISEWPSLVRSMVSKWSADKILVPGPRSVFLILCFSSHINIDIFSWILLSSGFRYSYLYISDSSCPPV